MASDDIFDTNDPQPVKKPPRRDYTYAEYLEGTRGAKWNPILTRWTNPTDNVVSFRVFIGHPRSRCAEGRTLHVAVDVGARSEISLPASWDEAIQLIRDGKVVGGLAPQLVHEDEGKRAPAHEALLPPRARWI